MVPMIHTPLVTLSEAKGLATTARQALAVVRFFALLRMTLFATLLFVSVPSFAQVSVTATVDRNRIAFGESLTFTITAHGTQTAPSVSIPKVDGLTFAGPAVNTSMSIVNGAVSQSVGLAYQVTPSRTGEFVIPAIEVKVGSQLHRTAPIKIVVEKMSTPTDLSQQVVLRVQTASQQVYLGQIAPLNVLIFARADVPLKGFSAYNCEADGLGYKYIPNIRTATHVQDGVSYNVFIIEGVIAPTRTGKLSFGPCVVKGQLAVERRGRPVDIFERFFGREEIREVPFTMDAVPIEVLPLPTEGRPADFSGAVGQWNLEVTAKPLEVNVGDPITLTIKVSGTGNIDLVPPPTLSGLDEFKTYDPTTKTTKNDLNSEGERVIQQVLVPKSAGVKRLPDVRLCYFDPVAKQYKTATHPPLQINVKPGAGGHATIVSGGLRLRPEEKLGHDIVYLKGSPGPVALVFPPTAFWALNLVPVFALLGAMAWKRRSDKLRSDIAFARRSRAARAARKLLATASTPDTLQHALQTYLGDHFNIPSAGITAAIVEERGLPATVREVFEACDAARFAGVPLDVAAVKQKVEQVIDELENASS